LSKLEKDSGTFEFFRRAVFQGNANESFADNRKGGYVNSKSDDQIVDYLVNHSMAIGYFGFSKADENKRRVSEIRIYDPQLSIYADDYVTPTVDSIRARRYPFTRPLFMSIWNDPENWDRVRPWIEFVLRTGVAQDQGVNITLPEKLVMLTRIGAQEGISLEDVSCGPSVGNLSIEVDSVIFPILDVWAKVFNVFCNNIHFNVTERGRSSNLSQLCTEGRIDLFGDFVDDAVNGTVDSLNEWSFTCLDSKLPFFTVDVAIDAVTVATNASEGGIAFECIKRLNGLTIDQLRWVYSSYNESSLEAHGWNRSSVQNLDGNSSTHLWSELSSECKAEEIILSGPNMVSDHL
jgi:ABC-type phosphate transport system substrate-binding protein